LENDKPIDILNYIKRIYSFPNAYITYRMLIILVLVVSTKMNFFKVKDNKNLFKINNISNKIKQIKLIIC